MNPELKTKWLAALRSDKYQQGHGILKTETNRYCCLGVLMDIQGCSWDNVRLDVSVIQPDQYQAGLTSDQMLTAARMNDDYKSFVDIANHIEKEF